MRKGLIVLMLGIFVAGSLVGCSSNKAGSSKEAINIAKAIEDTQEKATYLISQAKTFYNSKEFQQAVDLAQYVLRYVDKDSQDAKSILEKAKTALKEAAGQAVNDVKSKMDNLIK
ncbi:MAG: hypothetical protein K9L86_08350 [Candidatus Omnitrophica bacterium]|nr:hypothetical protein [Candidatus Omnitrophota bacterium]